MPLAWQLKPAASVSLRASGLVHRHLEGNYRVLEETTEESNGLDHCSPVVCPPACTASLFSLSSVVQAINWVLGHLASKGSAVSSGRHLHSHRLRESLKTKHQTAQQKDRAAFYFSIPTGKGHMSLKERWQSFSSYHMLINPVALL